jgi:hypothetical protein
MDALLDLGKEVVGKGLEKFAPEVMERLNWPLFLYGVISKASDAYAEKVRDDVRNLLGKCPHIDLCEIGTGTPTPAIIEAAARFKGCAFLVGGIPLRHNQMNLDVKRASTWVVRYNPSTKRVDLNPIVATLPCKACMGVR